VRSSVTTIESLPQTVRRQVRKAYGVAFGLESDVLLGIGVVALLVSLGTMTRTVRMLEEIKEEQTTWEKNKSPIRSKLRMRDSSSSQLNEENHSEVSIVSLK
jgi:hypothetical protein